MKKIIVSALAIVMAMSTLLFTGCGSELTPAELDSYYLVTVNGGTGGGNYFEGSLVMCEPTVPDDQQFMYWEQNGNILSSSAEYAFEVYADTTITAIFSDAVDGAGLETTAITVTGVVDKNGTYYETALDGNTSGFGTGGYLLGGNATVATVETVTGDKTFLGWVDVTDVAEGGTNTAIMGTDEVLTFEVEKETKVAPKYDVVFERLNTPGPKTLTGGTGTMGFDQNRYVAHDSTDDYYYFGATGPAQGSSLITEESIAEKFVGFGLEMTAHGSNWYCDGYPTADQYVQASTSKDTTIHDRVSMLTYLDPFYISAGCSKYGFREETLAIKYTVYSSSEEDDNEVIGYFFASYDNNSLTRFDDEGNLNSNPGSQWALYMYFDATLIATTDAEISAQWPNACNYLFNTESEFQTVLGGAIPSYQSNGGEYHISSSIIPIVDSCYESEDGTDVYYIPSLENDRVVVKTAF